MPQPVHPPLDASEEFLGRHLGPSSADQQKMLAALGLDSLQQLAERSLPPDIFHSEELKGLPGGISEGALLAHMHHLAQQNKPVKSMIGLGFYNCYCPQVLVRNVLENPGWYTAYTPYQAEISQGRLEGLANFQTMVASLCGLDLANASLLDEASACAEAMAVCARVSKKSARFFVSQRCHPQNIEVVRLRGHHAGIEIIVGDEFAPLPQDLCGMLLAYPASDGHLPDYRTVISRAQQQGSLVVLCCDLLALTLLTSPGELGADLAVGSAQRFGQPLGFGGPHAAFIASRQAFHRALPGRLIGVSQDRLGGPVYRMALQTREQHIRREKATSNICTAQALLAIIAGFYGIYHGPQGLRRIAQRVNLLARILAGGLTRLGLTLRHRHFFDTVTFHAAGDSAVYLQKAREKGYNLWHHDGSVSIACDETTTLADITTLLACFGGRDEGEQEPPPSIPSHQQRQSAFMTHPVFHRYHSETEMMRYLRKLVNRDLALDRGMIPLGSCTMKLNAACEMAPLSYPGFANIHPFAPAEQTQGYQQLIHQLEQWLATITGYDAVSLQPNAGSQGEYGGLLAIKAWQQARGESQRDVCLIPTSAHGTNPATARMVGMQVVAVACNANGDIDLPDLENKIARHRHHLAALMLTYPSTHGVFEAEVRRMCQLVHDAGGQVYIDGANLNAQVGLAYPGEYGGDVSHLNLHKTFCIPHGGGGPGVGALAAKEHLRAYLPGHSLVNNGQGREGALTSAPWGSASILTISYAYLALMGGRGLRRASLVAVLAANYLAARLSHLYPVLYRGASGMVAHEFILDIRPLEKRSGISSEDLAKRLIDYGFHAPTLSFPVAGTLMIEPTESESLYELDRFIEALTLIRAEIDEVIEGTVDRSDNLLKNAPHTAAEVTADHWSHPYSRQRAAFPVARLAENKYWPPVSRIDNAYGDRNLFCACIPVEEAVQ